MLAASWSNCRLRQQTAADVTDRLAFGKFSYAVVLAVHHQARQSVNANCVATGAFSPNTSTSCDRQHRV